MRQPSEDPTYYCTIKQGGIQELLSIAFVTHCLGRRLGDLETQSSAKTLRLQRELSPLGLLHQGDVQAPDIFGGLSDLWVARERP